MLSEAIAGGERALVFSQFAEMGALLSEHLVSLFGREVAFLHGAVPKKARDEMVQRFQEDDDGPPIFVTNNPLTDSALSRTASAGSRCRGPRAKSRFSGSR